MARIDAKRNAIEAKVVYYGPGLCGKTTNLEQVCARVGSELMSLATEGDRTIFFDFFPLEVGKIRQMDTTFKLYTVPGQVVYNQTRKMVLKNVDGVVFVVDSRPFMLDANLESFENLFLNLEELGVDPKKIQLVLQYNKRDVPDAVPIEELNELFPANQYPVLQASAVKGEGVVETLDTVCRLVLNQLVTELDGRPQAAAAPAKRPPPAPPTPPPGPAPTKTAAPPAKPAQPPPPAPKEAPVAPAVQPAGAAPPEAQVSSAALSQLEGKVASVRQELGGQLAELGKAVGELGISLKQVRESMVALNLGRPSEAGKSRAAATEMASKSDVVSLRSDLGALAEKTAVCAGDIRDAKSTLDEIVVALRTLPDLRTLQQQVAELRKDLAAEKDDGIAEVAAKISATLAKGPLTTEWSRMFEREFALLRNELSWSAQAPSAQVPKDFAKIVREQLVEVIRDMPDRFAELVASHEADRSAHAAPELEDLDRLILERLAGMDERLDSLIDKLSRAAERVRGSSPQFIVEEKSRSMVAASAEQVRQAPEPPPASSGNGEALAAPPVAEEPQPAPAPFAPPEDHEPPRPDAEDGATVQQASTPPEEERIEQAPPPPEAEPAAAAAEEKPEPAPASATATAPSEAQEEDDLVAKDPRHRKAQRIARVMVEDLYLYYKNDFELGIREGDFAERNKDALNDIRATYESRVSADVRMERNHLDRELERFVARKRQELGID